MGTSATNYVCKGSHVEQARIWIDEILGPGTFRELVKDAGRLWRINVVSGSWYEVAPLAAALKTVAARTGRSVEECTREIATRNARDDLRSIYRVFMTIAAPVRVLSFTPRLWSTYVKFGSARAIKNDQGHYVGECTGIPSEYLDWVCGAWLGFVPTTIEVAGGRNIRGAIINRWAEMDGGLHGIHCEVRYGK